MNVHLPLVVTDTRSSLCPACGERVWVRGDHLGTTTMSRLTTYARRLRHDQTDAERRLWRRLRGRFSARAHNFGKPAVEAAGAVDAKNAPTAPWKTAKNAVSRSYHRPLVLDVGNPTECYPCSRLTLLPMFPVAQWWRAVPEAITFHCGRYAVVRVLDFVRVPTIREVGQRRTGASTRATKRHLAQPPGSGTATADGRVVPSNRLSILLPDLFQPGLCQIPGRHAWMERHAGVEMQEEGFRDSR